MINDTGIDTDRLVRQSDRGVTGGRGWLHILIIEQVEMQGCQISSWKMNFPETGKSSS